MVDNPSIMGTTDAFLKIIGENKVTDVPATLGKHTTEGGVGRPKFHRVLSGKGAKGCMDGAAVYGNTHCVSVGHLCMGDITFIKRFDTF